MSKLIHYSGPAGSYILPSGYTRLAWIEGNGNSYIDTGWKYTSGDMTVDIEYTMPTNNNVTVIGSSNDNTKWATLIYHYNGVRLYYCGTQSAAYSKAITAGTKINTIYGISGSNVFIKDERYNTVNKTGYSASCGTIPSQSYTYTLFCHHYSNTYTQIAACKMYHCNIWDKGVLIRQYVPVKTTSAVTNAYGTSSSVGTCGMLDLVNNSFYPSKTSTGFTGSVEVAPGFPTEQYCQVEWLWNDDRTAWIELPRTLKPNTVMKAEMQITNSISGTYQQVMGYATSTSWNPYGLGTNNNGWVHYSASVTPSTPPTTAITTVTLTNTGESTEITGSTLGLFKMSGAPGDSTYLRAAIKLQRCQVLEGTTIVMDLIPCYRRSDMQPGVYDIVGRAFYTNTVGKFSLGPSITFGYGMVENSAQIIRKVPIPSIYEQLDYIQSTGTQWIDTGTKLTKDFKFFYTINVQNAGSGSAMPWATYVSGNRYTCQFPNHTTVWFQRAGGTLYQGDLNGTILNKDLYIIETLNSVNVNGINYGNGTFTFTQNNTNVGLFNSPGSNYQSANKLGIFQWYDDNKLVHYYVPARRKSDGVIGLYDIANNEFKTNSGIGTFIAGPVHTSFHAIPHNISSGEGRMGENNGSFDFSGINAYLNTDGQVTGKTYMGWFYTESKPAREVFFADSASGIAFGTYNNGTQAIVATGTSAKIIFTLNTWNTGWNHIAVVKSNDGPQLYINGIVQTAISSTNLWTHNGGLWIGARSTFNGNFSGRCQDFKVFDTALNQAQIQQEM